MSCFKVCFDDLYYKNLVGFNRTPPFYPLPLPLPLLLRYTSMFSPNYVFLRINQFHLKIFFGPNIFFSHYHLPIYVAQNYGFDELVNSRKKDFGAKKFLSLPSRTTTNPFPIQSLQTSVLDPARMPFCLESFRLSTFL